VKPDSFATNAYDATRIVADALATVYKNTGKFDRADVRDAVAATKDFPGVAGVVNFAENGDLIAYQGVYKVNGTTPEYLGAYSVIDGKLTKVN
jgi:branched-chain amino acid transport system substrate-binding protein